MSYLCRVSLNRRSPRLRARSPQPARLIAVATGAGLLRLARPVAPAVGGGAVPVVRRHDDVGRRAVGRAPRGHRRLLSTPSRPHDAFYFIVPARSSESSPDSPRGTRSSPTSLCTITTFG